MDLEAQKRELIEVGKLLFMKGVTETCGASFTVRAGEDRYLQTPSGVAFRRWNIMEDEVLLYDDHWRLLEGQGRIPADSLIHRMILQEFAHAQACLHVHARYSLVFASLEEPIPPMTETTQSLGEVPVMSEQGADVGLLHLDPIPEILVPRPDVIAKCLGTGRRVINTLRPRAEELSRHGLAVLLPRHGVIVVGRSFLECYDNLERIEMNAFVQLQMRMVQARAFVDLR